jgi:hypothetical protein
MENLITIIVAGVEVIFSGSEMILVFMEDTEILGASLYGWFLGYLLIDTVINIFIPFDDEQIEIIVDKKEPLPNPFSFVSPTIETLDGEIGLYDIELDPDFEDER